MYGENCGIACGNCLAKEQCHHINGTCMNGCDRGYQGSKCTEGDHCYLMLKTWCFNSKYMIYYSVMMFFYLECDELGSTVKSNVTQTVLAVIKRQVYVIRGVNLVGKECLAKKVKYITDSFIQSLK